MVYLILSFIAGFALGVIATFAVAIAYQRYQVRRAVDQLTELSDRVRAAKKGEGAVSATPTLHQQDDPNYTGPWH